MSEERMDRKSVARSAPPKVAAADCKKSSDSVHRQWPRSGKKREGSSSSWKSDVQRRYVPPPRGGRDTPGTSTTWRSTFSREEGTGLDAEMELGLPSAPGSKKQNLNHLLKFVCSPRELNRHGEMAPRRVHPPLRRPQHSKLFLQASCQVAVRAGGDYKKHLLDPDLPLDWTHVEHVVVRSEATECPVCLAAPVAARVTRCGHVYCWPCALHYLNVDERTSPPCPVCAAPLRADQLRSASVRHSSPTDQVITMRLVRRERHSTLVSPAPERTARPERLNSGALPVWSPDEDLPYAKIVTITPAQVRKIIERERCELKQQILDEIDTSELEYLERALELLAGQERTLDLREATNLSGVFREPDVIPSSPTDEGQPNHYTMPDTMSEQPKMDWFDLSDLSESGPPISVNNWFDSSVSSANLDLDISIKLDLDMSSKLDPADEDELEKLASLTIDEPEETKENPMLNVVEADEAGVTEGAIGGIANESEATVEGDDVPKVTQADRDNANKYFYFYQAEDGRHVFLHGADVRLLTVSWGSLAAAPRTITGKVLRVDSQTVTHENRRHNPCTAHLPLYCPYDIVELELTPPHVTPRALRLLSDQLQRRAAARRALAKQQKRRERVPQKPQAPHLESMRHFPPAIAKVDVRPPSPLEPPLLPSAPVDIPPQPARAGPSFAKMASASGAWTQRTPPRPSPPAEPARAVDDDTAVPPRVLSLADAFEAALRAAPRRQPKKKKNKQ